MCYTPDTDTVELTTPTTTPVAQACPPTQRLPDSHRRMKSVERDMCYTPDTDTVELTTPTTTPVAQACPPTQRPPVGKKSTRAQRAGSAAITPPRRATIPHKELILPIEVPPPSPLPILHQGILGLRTCKGRRPGGIVPDFGVSLRKLPQHSPHPHHTQVTHHRRVGTEVAPHVHRRRDERYPSLTFVLFVSSQR